jgi:hypothetical protein
VELNILLQGLHDVSLHVFVGSLISKGCYFPLSSLTTSNPGINSNIATAHLPSVHALPNQVNYFKYFQPQVTRIAAAFIPPIT